MRFHGPRTSFLKTRGCIKEEGNSAWWTVDSGGGVTWIEWEMGGEATGSGERKFFYLTCGCPTSTRSVLAHFKPLFRLFLKMQRCRKKLEKFFENYLSFPEIFSPEMECRSLEKTV